MVLALYKLYTVQTVFKPFKIMVKGYGWFFADLMVVEPSNRNRKIDCCCLSYVSPDVRKSNISQQLRSKLLFSLQDRLFLKQFLLKINGLYNVIFHLCCLSFRTIEPASFRRIFDTFMDFNLVALLTEHA